MAAVKVTPMADDNNEVAAKNIDQKILTFFPKQGQSMLHIPRAASPPVNDGSVKSEAMAIKLAPSNPALM